MLSSWHTLNGTEAKQSKSFSESARRNSKVLLLIEDFPWMHISRSRKRGSVKCVLLLQVVETSIYMYLIKKIHFQTACQSHKSRIPNTTNMEHCSRLAPTQL